MTWEPVAHSTYRQGKLKEKVEEALRLLEHCALCPRNCGINRIQDEKKVCHTGRRASVSSAFPHFGEEDCLRGWRGSGTIFFSHCNLRCVFCQNYDISQGGEGKEASAEEVASMMIRLQHLGCHNINFVTPEHVVAQVLEATLIACEKGLSIPIVYNTSAYDSLESLRLLEGVVDIYMPDFKFFDPEPSLRYLKARDYPEAAREAIREMHRQVGPLTFDQGGLARKGVLVRHLVMPGFLDQTRKVMNFLAKEVSPDTYVNVMMQYRPAGKVGNGQPHDQYPEIDRTLTLGEYRRALQIAKEEGLHRFDPQSDELS